MTEAITFTHTVPERLPWAVFVTALEGGIGYWSRAYHYHTGRRNEVGGYDDDLQGFNADVMDCVAHDGDVPWKLEDEDDERLLTIDRSTILKGLEAIATRRVKLAERIHEAVEADLRGAGGAIDAEAADCVVQAGLFGEVIYG
tara:strand:+ start:4259 stop:4687 length:429 start_codon:yes stop_codon:yes gene_type:complete